MDDEKIVVDTNVLLSATLNEHGAAGQAYSAVIENYTILQSEETFAEFVEVINRKKFDKYISSDARYITIGDLYNGSDFVEVNHTVESDICRDTKDNKFLELAVSGEAKYIVSGDKDLLDIGEYKGIDILSPRDFLEREKLREKETSLSLVEQTNSNAKTQEASLTQEHEDDHEQPRDPSQQREPGATETRAQVEQHDKQQQADQAAKVSPTLSQESREANDGREMTDKEWEKQARVDRYLNQMKESEREMMERGGGQELTQER
jgi:putative PIN family toxin of toxin-antitoxin system